MLDGGQTLRCIPSLRKASQRSMLFAATCVALSVLVSCGTTRSAGATPTATSSLATATATAPPQPTSTPSSLDQQVDAYISQLSLTQQIGQLLMLAVYANGYSSAYDQPLQQWDIANAIVYNNYNGGPLMPTTLSGFTQLIHDLQAHANQPLIVATDEEGGIVDRLAPYYGETPSPQALAATGDPQNAYNQAQTDAQRLSAAGINVDFAPLADVYQGGAVDQSRMFGTTPDAVATYAGAFLDGLQQNGIEGTLKHWPGLGAASANPDYSLPTVTHTQAQLNAIDFASFRALLSHHPGMIMVTHVIVPAYDSANPASLSPTLVDGVLRGQLGYQGVVVTDAMDAQGLIQFMQQQGYADPAQGIAEASVRAILAGADLIECPIEPDRLAAVVTAVTNAVQSGRISQARLHESVHRIIKLKAQMGLITLP
jgi:beta-N-acetylhexosaminidase